MEAEFWQKKWQDKDIAFHCSEANPQLLRHFDALGLAPGSRVLLPLCGKTRDIAWLRERGMRVVGVELSRIAVEELFAELGETPVLKSTGALQHYHCCDGLDIYQGDIFALGAEQLGEVDAIYDRAALVALPTDMRGQYSRHLLQMSDAAPQLLINYDYDQRAMPGPPFSISDEELQAHYGDVYQLQSLQCQAVAGGLKGKCPAWEKVWLLQPRA